MSNYRRIKAEGGMYFFTVVTHQRRHILCTESGRATLRRAIESVRQARPFDIRAFVLLGDHFHTLWSLPEGDSDYSWRLGQIKRLFTRDFLVAGGQEGQTTPSRAGHRVRGVWQKRFHEHTIRDYRDFKEHLDYIHMNPVKHGLAGHASDWPWSSFKAYMAKGEYDIDWAGPVHLPGGADIEPDRW